jgi:hypothetical protein
MKCQDYCGVRCQDVWKNQVLEGGAVAAKRFLGVEDLEAYKKLCRLHIEKKFIYNSGSAIMNAFIC